MILKQFISIELLQVDASLHYKYGTIYREVMHTPRIVLCNSKNNKI